MAGFDGEGSGDVAAQVQRLDRWLWISRVLKSRTSAAQLIEDGRVRVNRVRVVKPSHSVRAGDVLTIALRGRVHILKVLAAGARRGPPPEARQLYEVVRDHNQALGAEVTGGVAKRERCAAARPSRRDRRLMEQFTGRK